MKTVKRQEHRAARSPAQDRRLPGVVTHPNPQRLTHCSTEGGDCSQGRLRDRYRLARGPVVRAARSVERKRASSSVVARDRGY